LGADVCHAARNRCKALIPAATIALLLAGALVGEAAAAVSARAGTRSDRTVTAQKIPRLDYHFAWITFAITIGLVVAYYVFVLMVSEREFRTIVEERFGGSEPDVDDSTDRAGVG
jgi:hypothetical protein